MNEMKTVGATYPLFMRLIIIKSSHFMTRGVNRINIIRRKITFKNEFKKSKQLEKIYIMCEETRIHIHIYYISGSIRESCVH